MNSKMPWLRENIICRRGRELRLDARPLLLLARSRSLNPKTKPKQNQIHRIPCTPENYQWQSYCHGLFKMPKAARVTIRHAHVTPRLICFTFEPPWFTFDPRVLVCFFIIHGCSPVLLIRQYPCFLLAQLTVCHISAEPVKL